MKSKMSSKNDQNICSWSNIKHEQKNRKELPFMIFLCSTANAVYLDYDTNWFGVNILCWVDVVEIKSVGNQKVPCSFIYKLSSKLVMEFLVWKIGFELFYFVGALGEDVDISSLRDNHSILLLKNKFVKIQINEVHDVYRTKFVSTVLQIFCC